MELVIYIQLNTHTYDVDRRIQEKSCNTSAGGPISTCPRGWVAITEED